MLAKVYDQVQNDKSPSWYLRGIPDYGFYQDLHKFLKKWPHIRDSSKVSIGKFYSVIDLNLRNKGLRPDNAYRFVDRLVLSKCSRDSIVKYGDADANLQTQVKECMKFTQTLITELEEVKRQRDEAEKKLSSTQVTLKEALDEVKRTTKCARIAEKKVISLQRLNDCRLTDFSYLTEKLEEVEKQNCEMSEILTLVQNELATVTDGTSITYDESTMSFTFETKCNGKQYSPTIRKLYYSLLSEQIPPAKISHTIKAVLKCFLPGLNVEALQLPKERCAGYMRTDELATVSLAHKATVIHKQIEEGSLLHLNTDGTTLGQRKLGIVTFNNVLYVLANY